MNVRIGTGSQGMDVLMIVKWKKGISAKEFLLSVGLFVEMD